MNFQISNFKFQIDQKGYTLIEFLIVITVIGIIAIVSWAGLGSNRQAESLKISSRQFADNLNGLQNKVVNGVDGASVKRVSLTNNASTYTFDGAVVTLPPGITYSMTRTDASGTNALGSATVCFSHPSLLSHGIATTSPLTACGACPAGSFFACRGLGLPGTQMTNATITVIFNGSNPAKSVIIEGSGMRINRIYAP